VAMKVGIHPHDYLRVRFSPADYTRFQRPRQCGPRNCALGRFLLS
jgi:hypothetical protein